MIYICTGDWLFQPSQKDNYTGRGISVESENFGDTHLQTYPMRVDGVGSISVVIVNFKLVRQFL